MLRATNPDAGLVAGSDSAGQSEHIGAGWSNAKCVAEEGRACCDQHDRGNPQTAERLRPGAETYGASKSGGSCRQHQGSVAIRTVGAVQRSESSNRGYQACRNVAHAPAEGNRRGDADRRENTASDSVYCATAPDAAAERTPAARAEGNGPFTSPGFDLPVAEGMVRRQLASAGRAVPQLRQSVGDRPAQLSNRLVGEDRSCASEPVDADIQDSQCLLELRQLGLKGRVISCLDLPKGAAERPDFRRQVSDIREHVFLRQIDFRQHGLSHRCSDVFGKLVDARDRDECNDCGDDHQDRRCIDQRQQQLPRKPSQPRGNPCVYRKPYPS
jgi:hypothetical protein